jgi:Flp pilus assembly protein TadG
MLFVRNQGGLKLARRCATATVEFAAIAPVLGIFIVGMLELGRGVMVKDHLTNAARHGAREATLLGRSNSDVESKVDTILQDNGFDPADATVTIAVNGDSAKNVSAAKRGDRVSVHVGLPFSKASWTGNIFYITGAVTSESVTMTRQ